MDQKFDLKTNIMKQGTRNNMETLSYLDTWNKF